MAEEYFFQRLQITSLKNLVDVEIEFEERKPLTALMGPNGFGKSTILHVLAAVCRSAKFNHKHTRTDIGENRRFTEFFPNTPRGSWAGTSVRLVTRLTRGETITIKPVEIKKEGGGWFPQTDEKIPRECYFIGVRSAMPEIEEERNGDEVLFTTDEIDNQKLLTHLGTVFNRKYTQYFAHAVAGSRTLAGLTYKSVSYSALAMGAGEQRVLKILNILLGCQKYALVLIDELDILLHTEAFHHLLRIMLQIASAKKLQVVFTTHRESVLDFNGEMAFRHLFTSPAPRPKSYCFSDSKPDAIKRLTGKQTQPLSVNCEDAVSVAIVRRIAQEESMAVYINLSEFGSWRNAFVLAAALAWKKQPLVHTLFVLDGDISDCATQEQYKEALNKVMAGTEAGTKAKKEEILRCFVQYTSESQISPEESLHAMICGLQNLTDAADLTMQNAFQQVEQVSDKHEFLTRPLRHLDLPDNEGLTAVVRLACQSTEWADYTKPVRDWLLLHKSLVVEELVSQTPQQNEN